MKQLIATLSMLALFAAAGAAGAQDKDKTQDKAAAEAKAEPAEADAKKEEARPAPNKGDVAWMLTSTALVLMMSVPALALFYGGMVRAKNMLSMLMQVFVVFSMVTVLWCVYGYSLAFTEGSGSLSPYFGGFSRLFLNGTFDAAKGTFENTATFSKGVVLPELVFVAFQATFAAITCCLILGAFAERARFSAVLVFIVLWFTFSYAPIAHMVWFWMGPDAYTDPKLIGELTRKAGLIWCWGALDFAGGTVAHIWWASASAMARKRCRRTTCPSRWSAPRSSGWAGSASMPARRWKQTASRRSPSSTLSLPPLARSSPGVSARPSSRAGQPCWARLPARSRAW